MGLKEKYINYLNNKKLKYEITDTLQQLPNELQHSIEPLQLMPAVREVLQEFISLIPNQLWNRFPGNASPKVHMNKTIEKGKYSDSGVIRCRFSVCSFRWYSQIMCNDNQVKSIEIKYKDSMTYENDVYKYYYSDRQRKNIEKEIDKKYSILEDEEKNHFISFRENYCAILRDHIKDLSQEFICLTYYEGLDEDGCSYSQCLVIFKDGNVYDWTRGYTPYTKGINPMKTEETAEAFLLEKLKHQPSSETRADGPCPPKW